MEKQDPKASPVDQGRRELVTRAGKVTVAAAATTLVLASGLKSNPAHAQALYRPVLEDVRGA